MTEKPTRAIEVFYCYAHEDEKLRKGLDKQLSLLKMMGYITDWYDQKINAGAEWDREIRIHLNSAQVILLLVSPDFLASEYCYSVEMKHAIARHNTGDACVIPIILRPCDWTSAPFAKLQVLPTNTKPISRWRNRDDAFLDVVQGIRKATEEQPGPVTTDSSPFDRIQKSGKDLLQDILGISLDDFTKHGMVAGVSGSGKTTTIMYLLDLIVDAEKPFLIIEPTKTDYRALYSGLSNKTNLRIYTPGNEDIAPFRLNPFEFETHDEPNGILILNHIDFLRAIFDAAFIQFTPLSHILEMALYEIYEDKGWDLASGVNTRLLDWSKRDLYPIFPTLTDFYRKVEIISNRLGDQHEYDRGIEWNMKAKIKFLKIRLRSLMLGSKGLMLDTARGLPMKQLLASPTIIEMENLGSDDEKAFLIGLLLAKIYEYRRLQAASGLLPHGLQHLIVFEEAHHLFKNISMLIGTEPFTWRSQAIEVFTDMLSKFRTYGQGVLISEQMPSRLTPDVLKKTKLKIVHRLISQDDKEIVGQTINLSVDQMFYLSFLKTGEAVTFIDGVSQVPYLLRLENYKRKIARISDTDLRNASPTYISLESCLAIPNIRRYDLPSSPFGVPNAILYQSAGKLLETEQSKWLWASILIRTVLSPSQLFKMIEKLTQQIAFVMPNIQPSQRDSLLQMVIVRGCAETLYERGANAGWLYPMIEEMRLSLTQGLIRLVQTKDLSCASSDLERFARRYESHLSREQGPYAGCIHCSAKCIYRLDVCNLLSSVDSMWVESDLENTSYKSETERYTALSRVAKGIAARWLGESSTVAPKVGFCSALHIAAKLGLNEYEQSLFADRLAPYLLE